MSGRPVFVTGKEGIFRQGNGEYLAFVPAGLNAKRALEQASCMMACIETLAAELVDGGGDASTAAAIQYLNEMAKALVDAAAIGSIAGEGDE